jgi:hypothetical protein
MFIRACAKGTFSLRQHGTHLLYLVFCPGEAKHQIKTLAHNTLACGSMVCMSFFRPVGRKNDIQRIEYLSENPTDKGKIRAMRR